VTIGLHRSLTDVEKGRNQNIAQCRLCPSVGNTVGVSHSRVDDPLVIFEVEMDLLIVSYREVSYTSFLVCIIMQLSNVLVAGTHMQL